MKNKQKIAIAGFGVEGRAVFKYLKEQPDFSNLDIHIFDESKDLGVELPSDVFLHSNLEITADFDVVYKTPGIPMSKLDLKNSETKISSLTNIFFEKAKGTIIGITGTKGKGTITTLINHILRENGFDSVVLGNIGVTGLEMLKDDKENKFYIYEMSSFQCEHLEKSPPYCDSQ